MLYGAFTNSSIITGMKIMKWFRLLAIAAMLLSVVAPATAQDKIVLGIELGAPFRMPACKPREDATASRLCFKDSMPYAKVPGVREYVISNITNPPSVYIRGDIHVMVIEGKVESVQIGTWGIDAQDNALKGLSDQYGPPTRSWREKPTGLRARIATRYAEWELRDFSVRLHGSFGSIDWGRIDASTPRYRKLVDGKEGRVVPKPAT